MMGAAIKPRIMPAFKTFKPTGTSKISMISGFIMLRPMNPQTTDGIAASNSTSTFRNSRVFPVANSAIKGIATIIASPVTLAVPTINARIP